MKAIGFISLMLIVLTLLAQAQPDPGAGRFGRRGPGQPPPGPPGRPPLEFMAERLAEELELTGAQRQQFDEIVAVYAAAMSTEPTGQRQRMQELGQAYREARLAGDEARAAQIREQMREQAGERGRMLDHFFDEVQTILEPAQVTKLQEMRNRRPRFGDRRGPEFWQRVQALPEELNLTPEQHAQFDRLLREHREMVEESVRLWHQERAQRVAEMEAAEEIGDEDRAVVLRESLLRSRPEVPDHDDFFGRLATILTEEQQARLAELRADPIGARPVDGIQDVREILRVARRLRLTDEQHRRLREINQQALAAERRLRLDDAARANLAARTKAQILEMLDADQKAEFEQWLDRDGRPAERPHRGPHRGPGAGPGGPPEREPRGTGPGTGPPDGRRLGR